MTYAQGINVTIIRRDYTKVAVKALDDGAKDAIKGITDFMYEKLRSYFEAGGTEAGPWERTVLPTGQPPLGGITGSIFRSIEVKKVGDKSYELSVTHPYAAVHEYGFFIKVPGAGVEHIPPMIYKLWKLGYTLTSPSKPFVRIPARPFFEPAVAATRVAFPQVARSYIRKELMNNLRTCSV